MDNDEILSAAAQRAADAKAAMNINWPAVTISGELDSKSPSEIMDFLDAAYSPAEAMVISGNWTVGGKRGVDTYDCVLRFIEDAFTKARAFKDPSGWYVAVAMYRLEPRK